MNIFMWVPQRLMILLPGFNDQNPVDLGVPSALISLWMGNQSRIAAHFDAPENLVCVVSGHRRFTLFPPEQITNLYVGPLEFNPAGQPISLVDFANPDFERFPRFRDALAAAQVAELEPGDALYLPSLWWHHVESLDSLNLMVNYWWKPVRDLSGNPLHALMHAMMSFEVCRNGIVRFGETCLIIMFLAVRQRIFHTFPKTVLASWAEWMMLRCKKCGKCCTMLFRVSANGKAG